MRHPRGRKLRHGCGWHTPLQLQLDPPSAHCYRFGPLRAELPCGRCRRPRGLWQAGTLPEGDGMLARPERNQGPRGLRRAVALCGYLREDELHYRLRERPRLRYSPRHTRIYHLSCARGTEYSQLPPVRLRLWRACLFCAGRRHHLLQAPRHEYYVGGLGGCHRRYRHGEQSTLLDIPEHRPGYGLRTRQLADGLPACQRFSGQWRGLRQLPDFSQCGTSHGRHGGCGCHHRLRRQCPHRHQPMEEHLRCRSSFIDVAGCHVRLWYVPLLLHRG